MHRGQRPRNLRDISHLYISASRKRPESEGGGPPALVLVVSLEAGPLRAWLSAGLGAAFGSAGARVVLLETGPGQPCAGYYFALPPGRYLRPVLDGEAVVEAGTQAGVTAFYSRNPSRLRLPALSGVRETRAGEPHVILVAFDRPAVSEGGGVRRLLDSIRSPSGEAWWRDLPAFILLTSQARDPGTGELPAGFGDLFPAAPVLMVHPGGSGSGAAGRLEDCPLPAGILEGLAMRRPPVSTFFSGLAAEILQRLGSGLKGAADGP